jgi:hypothetical protein
MNKGQSLQNLETQSNGSCALHFYPMRSIYLQSFMLISLIYLELCHGQSSKCKNDQRAITPKFGKVKLWFLWTAHFYPICSIYLQSFMLIPLVVSVFRVICQKKTRWMDKAATLCSPFREHKNTVTYLCHFCESMEMVLHICVCILM